MKILGLDGREYPVNIEKYIVYDDDKKAKSSLHLEARTILKERFPLEAILEEFNIPGSRLFCDFFIPAKRIVVEVQGEQHYKFNPHFFLNKLEFFEAKRRDAQKAQWCVLNDLTLYEFVFNNKSEWSSYLG